jgi:hypothetical protein
MYFALTQFDSDNQLCLPYCALSCQKKAHQLMPPLALSSRHRATNDPGSLVAQCVKGGMQPCRHVKRPLSRRPIMRLTSKVHWTGKALSWRCLGWGA